MSDGANFRETDVTYKAKANFSELMAQVAAAQAAIAALRAAEKKANDESIAENEKVAASRAKAADALGKQTAAEKEAGKAAENTAAETVKETAATKDNTAAKDAETLAAKKAAAAKADEAKAKNDLATAMNTSLKAYKDAIKASTDLTDAEKKSKAASADADYFAQKLKNSYTELATSAKDLFTGTARITEAEKAGVSVAKEAEKASSDLAAAKRRETVEQNASLNVITRSANAIDSILLKTAAWLAVQGDVNRSEGEATTKTGLFQRALSDSGSAVGKFGDFLGKVGTQWLPRFVGWMDAGIQRLAFWRRSSEDAATGLGGFTEKLSLFQRAGNLVSALLTTMGNGFMALSTKMSGLGFLPMLLMGIPALLPALASILNIVGPLVAGLGALGAGTLAFASNLSTLATGLVGVVPLLAGAVTAFTALKMAFSGLTGKTGALAAYDNLQQAMSTPGTTPAALLKAQQDYTNSMKQLTPAAQTFAKWVASIKDGFGEIQKQVQQGFFSGFVGDLGKVNDLLKPLQGLLVSVAKALGLVADQVVKELGGPVWTQAIHDLSTSMTPLMHSLGSALVSVLDLFAHLSVAAMPFATKVVQGLANITMSLSNMLDTPTKMTAFTGFLDTVWKRLLVWLDILKNIGLVFARYSSAASGWSDGYVQGFDKITKGWADLAKAAEAPNSAFKQYLENIKPLLSAIGGLIHQFIDAVKVAMFSPTNIKNMTDAVVAIGHLGTALAGLYGTLTKGGQVSNVINVITDVVNLVNDLLKNGGIQVLQGLWAVLDDILKFLDALANMPVVGPLLGTIVTSLSALALLSFAAGKFAGLIDLIASLIALSKAPALIGILSKLPVLGTLAAGAKDTNGISAAAYKAAPKGATPTQLRAIQDQMDTKAGVGIDPRFTSSSSTLKSAASDFIAGRSSGGSFSSSGEFSGETARGGSLGGTLAVAGISAALSMLLQNKDFQKSGPGQFIANPFGLSPQQMSAQNRNMFKMTGLGSVAASADKSWVSALGVPDSHVFGVGTSASSQDTQLAKMVKAGDLKDAQHGWQDLVSSAKQYGVTEQQLASFYPKFVSALNGVTSGQKAHGKAVDATTQSMQAAQSALQSQLNDYKALGNAQDNANLATKAVTASLKANGTSLSANTVAGRANLQAVLTAVQQYQNYGNALAKVTGRSADGTVATDKLAISMVNSMVKMGVSRTAAENLVKSLLGIPKNISINTALKNAEAMAKAQQTRDYLLLLGKGNYTAILKGDFTPAQKAAARAVMYADMWAKGDYKGIMKGDFTPAQKAAAQAKEYSILFAKGDYKGIMRGDFTPAQKAAAAAKQKAKEYADAKYMAKLQADQKNASTNIVDAARKAHAFAVGNYRAILNADASPAISAAARAVAEINNMTASITMSVNAVGGNGYQVARNYLLTGATGGLVPQHFAVGGQVKPNEWQGSSTDTVPAMLTPGEFVLRKSVVDAIGVENLRNLNNGMAHYAQFISGAMQQVRPVSPSTYTSDLPAWLKSNPVMHNGGSGQSFGNIIINNPVPERASDTLQRTARKVGYLRASR